MNSAFPNGFLWGAATSSHQVEGGNVNNDFWEMEHRPDTFFSEPSSDACDSWHRWEEDLDIVAGLGLNTYRFSLEWSRIEPEPGEVSRVALDHYRRMVAGCRERGLNPVVTLQHFTVPRWMTAAGGWAAPGSADRFARYCETVLPILAEGVSYVCTINEPNLAAMTAQLHMLSAEQPAFTGVMPAPHRPTADALVAAHARAVDILHGRSGIAVGWTIASQVVQAAPGGDEAAAAWSREREDFFLEAAKGDDFIGVQAYTRTVIGPDGPLPVPETAEQTLTDWECYPQALEQAVRHTWQITSGVPILVTENGIATADDTRRIDYTRTALHGLRAAMDDGIDVRGYIHWSLLDNFEWVAGYKPTFGLVAVDRHHFTRTPKPSAHWLGTIARTGHLAE
ncbi:family 1 glycosylhydrolase [Streptomyces flavidovirens]|uniref:glycoside hydrolase family 1 protein n=1 Tax=Streptomyces flavidovirens TaxID=67298 RepID=UPI0034152252